MSVRREYSRWDIWYAVFDIIAGIVTTILFIIGLVYNLVFFQVISYILGFLIFVAIYLLFTGRLPSPKRNSKFTSDSRKEIFKFLKEHIGEAYNTKTLLNRMENYVKSSRVRRYLKKYSAEILNGMISDGIIQTTLREGQIHYFIV